MSQSLEPPSIFVEDENLEVSLRPQVFAEFKGQDKICQCLDVSIQAALQRKEALSHCLLVGPPGLGKTTFANLIARSMQGSLVATSGPTLEKAGDLAGLLTNLSHGDILFIDEIHRLHKSVEEYLYSAMEDFILDLMIDSGPNARSVRITLPPFTLIGATTKSGLLSAPFRSRFTGHYRLEYYNDEVLSSIIQRSGVLLEACLDGEVSKEIAKRSRGTPRIANNLLKWVRDYAQIHNDCCIDMPTVLKALNMLSIDKEGLDALDKKILTLIIEHYDGGPVGLNTLAVAIGEDSSTIEEVYEPYLILKGFLKRTIRGREVSSKAYQHLGKAKHIKGEPFV